ncbi:MAG: enoyl-CoA hydratase/isomerase family protein [Burkholderiales bacterium]
MIDDIRIDIRNHIGHITLNRPDALNALSHSMIRTMHAQLRDWERDKNVYAVMLRGAGDKAFCAGGDIRAVYDSLKNGGDSPEKFFVDEYELDYYLHRYRKPVVVLMDGIVMGGGSGLAMAAALRLVGDKTIFAMPETRIGFFPDVGATYFLSRLLGHLGDYLGITGAQLKAADCLYASIGDVYLTAEQWKTLDVQLDNIEWGDDKRWMLVRSIKMIGESKLPDPPLAKLHDVINEHFSKPTLQAIAASLNQETRPDYRAWAANTLAAMHKRSPTMMAVTLEQVRRGHKLDDLADAFRMELNMLHGCFAQKDFQEGIRALIVDKDNAPKWNPPTIEQVQAEEVRKFFVPAWHPDEHPLATLGT